MRPEEQALICAKAAAAVYGTQEDSEGNVSCKAVMGSLGFDRFLWYDLPTDFQDFYAFVASSSDYHLLVFRGTKSPKDWITDLQSTTTPFDQVFDRGPAIGNIHSGFGICLAEAYDRLILPLQKCDPKKPLLIAGHSLGGALAALAGLAFKVFRAPVPPIERIYTFGQPRIGLRNLCDNYGSFLPGKLIRFVNKRDVVPHVPFRGLDYSDEGTLIHFNSLDKPLTESPEWEAFNVRVNEGFEDLLGLLEQSGTEIGDHSVVKYRDLIANSQSDLAQLI